MKKLCKYLFNSVWISFRKSVKMIWGWGKLICEFFKHLPHIIKWPRNLYWWGCSLWPFVKCSYRNKKASQFVSGVFFWFYKQFRFIINKRSLDKGFSHLPRIRAWRQHQRTISYWKVIPCTILVTEDLIVESAILPEEKISWKLRNTDTHLYTDPKIIWISA